MHEHGPDCAECRRLETEYGEVAGRLAFALEPVAVRHTFQEQTIELALGERAEAPAREPERDTGGARAPRDAAGSCGR